MSFKTLLLATASVVAISSGAMAADLPSKKGAAAAPLPVFTWTGFYVGASVGTVSSMTDYSSADYGSWEKSSTQGSGALAGLGAGYNYQYGNVVVGLEGDYSFATAKSGFGDSNYVAGESKLTGFGTLRARFGFALDRTLVYATGGLAIANLQSKTVLYNDDADCRSAFKKASFGWTAGAGVEHALSNNVTLKIEALYADFGKKSVLNSDNCGCTTSFKNTAAVARVGLNYKF